MKIAQTILVVEEDMMHVSVFKTLLRRFPAGMVGLFALIFLGSSSSFALPPQAFCSRSLESLKHLQDDLAEDTTEHITELRDGLFTVASVESSLFTSNVFKNTVNESIATLRDLPPDENWGLEELGALKENLKLKTKEYKEQKRVLEFASSERQIPVKVLKAEVKASKVKIKGLEKERKQKLKLRKEMVADGDPEFSMIPSLTKVRMASSVWEKISAWYELPASPDALSLEESSKLNDRVVKAGMEYPEFLSHFYLVQEINKDPVVKNEIVGLIADLMAASQAASLKNSSGLKAKILKNGRTDLEQNQTPMIIVSGINSEEVLEFKTSSLDGQKVSAKISVPLKVFVTETHPLLFNLFYFEVVSRVLNSHNLKPSTFAAHFQSFSPTMKRELSQEIWTALAQAYKIEDLNEMTPKQMHDFTRVAPEYQSNAETFLLNAYALKSLDQSDAQTRASLLRLIEDNLSNSAEIIPHLESAATFKVEKEKEWRIQKIIANPFIVTPTVMAVTVGVLGAGHHIHDILNLSGGAHFLGYGVASGLVAKGGGYLSRGITASRAKLRNAISTKLSRQTVNKFKINDPDNAE